MPAATAVSLSLSRPVSVSLSSFGYGFSFGYSFFCCWRCHCLPSGNAFEWLFIWKMSARCAVAAVHYTFCLANPARVATPSPPSAAPPSLWVIKSLLKIQIQWICPDSCQGFHHKLSGKSSRTYYAALFFITLGNLFAFELCHCQLFASSTSSLPRVVTRCHTLHAALATRRMPYQQFLGLVPALRPAPLTEVSSSSSVCSFPV